MKSDQFVVWLTAGLTPLALVPSCEGELLSSDQLRGYEIHDPTTIIMVPSCHITCMNKLFAVPLAQRDQHRKLWREDLFVNSVKHTDLVREGGVLFV